MSNSRDCMSTPTVSTLRAVPERIIPWAIDTAYSQPEQAAFRSKAGIVCRFSRSCKMAAVEGMATSGVVVATITASMSLAAMPERRIASNAAW